MRKAVLGLLVIAVMLAGVLMFRFGRAPQDAGLGPGQGPNGAAPPTSVASGAPTSVAAAPTVAPKPTVPAATPTPASRDVVMEVSESELQSQLSTMLVGKSLGRTPLGDATIQTVTVALRNRQVQVGGAAKAGFLNAPFTAAGTLAPDSNGRPKVTVSDAEVGGVKLPDGTRAALADLLQTEVDGMFSDPSLKVRTIDIVDGKMRVVSTTGS